MQCLLIGDSLDETRERERKKKEREREISWLCHRLSEEKKKQNKTKQKNSTKMKPGGRFIFRQ